MSFQNFKQKKELKQMKKKDLSKIAVGTVAAAGIGTAVYFHKNPREKIISIAEKEIGIQNPDKYWSVVQPKLVKSGASWCGGFALWVLKEAGFAAEATWDIGKGFVTHLKLPTTSKPQPGDIAYFQKNQHHAIVKKVDGEELVTIDGNQSPGESVKERIRNISDATAYYSIEPLISS